MYNKFTHRETEERESGKLENERLERDQPEARPAALRLATVTILHRTVLFQLNRRRHLFDHPSATVDGNFPLFTAHLEVSAEKRRTAASIDLNDNHSV